MTLRGCFVEWGPPTLIFVLHQTHINKPVSSTFGTTADKRVGHYPAPTNLISRIRIGVCLDQHLHDWDMAEEGCPVERGPSNLILISYQAHMHTTSTSQSVRHSTPPHSHEWAIIQLQRTMSIAFGLALALSSISTIGAWPYKDAMWSGVHPC
jgi:hypothetical protein